MKKAFSKEAESLISSFRGYPQKPSRAWDAGTKPFGSLLEACIQKYHIGKSTPEELILENWVRIVGPTFSKRCRPERIDSGTLVVQAANSVVRQELQFMESRILTALGSLKGCQHIHRIVTKAGQ